MASDGVGVGAEHPTGLGGRILGRRGLRAGASVTDARMYIDSSVCRSGYFNTESLFDTIALHFSTSRSGYHLRRVYSRIQDTQNEPQYLFFPAPALLRIYVRAFSLSLLPSLRARYSTPSSPTLQPKPCRSVDFYPARRRKRRPQLSGSKKKRLRERPSDNERRTHGFGGSRVSGFGIGL